jgi:hypothetical protein
MFRRIQHLNSASVRADSLPIYCVLPILSEKMSLDHFSLKTFITWYGHRAQWKRARSFINICMHPPLQLKLYFISCHNPIRIYHTGPLLIVYRFIPRASTSRLPYEYGRLAFIYRFHFLIGRRKMELFYFISTEKWPCLSVKCASNHQICWSSRFQALYTILLNVRREDNV